MHLLRFISSVFQESQAFCKTIREIHRVALPTIKPRQDSIATGESNAVFFDASMQDLFPGKSLGN
jgi:hypothetical protein